MNRFNAIGRLTADPEIRYRGANNTAVAHFTIAVQRRFKREGEPEADFFRCVVFGKTAEFIEKYYRKGFRVAVTGEVRNNNYTNKDGNMVYATEILVSGTEFADGNPNAGGQNSGGQNAGGAQAQPNNAPAPNQTQFSPAPSSEPDRFMNIPEGIDEELPFN